MRVSKAAVFTAFASLMGGSAVAQGDSVIPDGVTDTSATIDASGHVTVNIADPVSDGISHNTYESFNVSAAGVDLDNRFVGARTILNEVTGADPSLIEGKIEVLGQRAHVILANPNGITVNGGEFVNTGGLLLTTGTTEFVGKIPAPNQVQVNPAFSVAAGVINVGPDGLSGAMDTLHIISREISIKGKVKNEFDSPFSEISLVAGASFSEINSAVLPRNNLSKWISTASRDVDSEGDILIDIARQGGLEAARISAFVTDRGAGVRYAGVGLASRQGFILNASGQIELSGADIISSTGVFVESSGGVVAAPSGRQMQLVAPNGSISIVSGGDIQLADTRLLAGEDVALDASGDVVLTSNSSTLGLELSSGGSARISAGGRHSISGGVLQVGGDVDVEAGVGISLVETDMAVAGNWRMETGGSFLTDSGSVAILGDALIRAADIVLDSVQSRQIVSADGSAEIIATEGAITINGARIDAGKASSSAGGALVFDAATDIRLMSLDVDRRGVLFGSGGDLVLRAGGNILNHAGRLVSNGDVSVVAGESFRTLMDLPNGSSEPSRNVENEKTDPVWWTLGLFSRSSRGFSLDYGAAPDGWRDAVVTASGDIDVTVGEAFHNIGGEFNANGGDINLAAREILLEGLVSGSAHYERRCFIVCSSRGESDIAVRGGRLNAAGRVTARGADSFYNLGGAVTGLEGVHISSDQIIFEALYVPTVVKQPAGLSNFWTGPAAFIYWRDVLGGVHVSDGTIELVSENPAQLLGVALAPEITIAEGGVSTLYDPRSDSPISDRRIGLFSEIF